MIRLRKSGELQVQISGMDTAIVPAAAWRAAIFEVAFMLQGIISEAFAAQRTARGVLRANDPRYTAQKIRQGYDPRRGHRTNTLQSFLRPSASQLFVVRGPDKYGNGSITMQEWRLRGIVPYAEYYADAKVQGGLILAIAASWLQRVKGPLLALEAEAKVIAQRALAGRAAFIRPALGLTNRLASSLGRQAAVALRASPQGRALLRRVR